MVGFVDWLHRLFHPPDYEGLKRKYDSLKKKYLLVKDFSPIDYIKTLNDDPKNVYVWILKDDISDRKYATNIGKMLAREGIELKSTHIFLTGDIKRIRKLDPDYVQNVMKFFYSDEAIKGGRK